MNDTQHQRLQTRFEPQLTKDDQLLHSKVAVTNCSAREFKFVLQFCTSLQVILFGSKLCEVARHAHWLSSDG